MPAWDIPNRQRHRGRGRVHPMRPGNIPDGRWHGQAGLVPELHLRDLPDGHGGHFEQGVPAVRRRDVSDRLWGWQEGGLLGMPERLLPDGGGHVVLLDLRRGDVPDGNGNGQRGRLSPVPGGHVLHRSGRCLPRDLRPVCRRQVPHEERNDVRRGLCALRAREIWPCRWGHGGGQLPGVRHGPVFDRRGGVRWLLALRLGHVSDRHWNER